MRSVIFTIVEGHYHHGVASLINSAIRAGFPDTFYVFYRGALPPWTQSLKKIGPTTFEVEKHPIIFHELDVSAASHPTYYKALAPAVIFNLHPDCEKVLYADPDVNFLAPWRHIDEWTSDGVAYCLDANFPYAPATHPWRKYWGHLVTAATGKSIRERSTYPNSGFFSVRRCDREFLEDWVAITRQFEKEGGNTESMQMKDRFLPVVGDQDLFAAALMGWDGPESALGPEGMGFNGHYIWLSHDIGQPKPWVRPFIRQALQGSPTTQAARYFLEFADGPIHSFTPWELRMKWLHYRLAQIISRVWHR